MYAAGAKYGLPAEANVCEDNQAVSVWPNVIYNNVPTTLYFQGQGKQDLPELAHVRLVHQQEGLPHRRVIRLRLAHPQGDRPAERVLLGRRLQPSIFRGL